MIRRVDRYYGRNMIKHELAPPQRCHAAARRPQTRQPTGRAAAPRSLRPGRRGAARLGAPPRRGAAAAAARPRPAAAAATALPRRPQTRRQTGWAAAPRSLRPGRPGPARCGAALRRRRRRRRPSAATPGGGGWRGTSRRGKRWGAGGVGGGFVALVAPAALCWRRRRFICCFLPVPSRRSVPEGAPVVFSTLVIILDARSPRRCCRVALAALR
jgi:hypothetical protein